MPNLRSLHLLCVWVRFSIELPVLHHVRRMEKYDADNMSLLSQFILSEVNINSVRIQWNLKDSIAILSNNFIF